MNITKEQLYKRQTILAEFGEVGQKKLQDAKIVIVGCGGLGSIAAVSLAASGVGKIHLIDFDMVDVSNLHRQVFYKMKDVGKSKAAVLAAHIRSITPFVEITTSDQPITKDNIYQQIDDYHVVVDCTDSLATKYLLNDYCVVTDRILVYGSLYKNDGYVASFNIPEGQYHSANLRHAFPKIPEEAMPNCSEVGTLNPIVGIIGLMQAGEVIKIITHTGHPLKNQILIYNSQDNSQYKMKLQVDRTHDHLGKSSIVKIFNNEAYFDTNCEIQKEALLISSDALKQQLHDKNQLIISVIEDVNTHLPFEVSQRIPFSKFDIDTLKIDTDKSYVFVCNKGILSYTATKLILKKHPDLKALSLKKGIIEY